LTIDTAAERDGWDVISTRDAVITNITIASNDDALAFKSDWALGATLPSGNVVVSNAHLSAVCCNALMFGSETCGDFSNYSFNDITITGSGKSGLGMTTNDGAHISNVRYNNVTMSGTDSPIFEKVGARLRCGNSPSIGSISDIHYQHVTGSLAGAFTPTLWGQPNHQITNVTFDDVNLTLPGGRAAVDPNAVPQDTKDYNPRSLGVRPSYGFYLHQASGITFTDTTLNLATDDARPAFIANTASDVKLNGVTLQQGSRSPFDVGFQSVTGFCVENTGLTNRARLRYSAATSTASCNKPDDFALATAPTAQSVTAGSSTTFTVLTTVLSGHPGPVTLKATGLRAGMSATFSPATVTPGHTATMTLKTTATARNGTYPLTIVGTDAGAAEYAGVTATVSGGVNVSITNLTAADTTNAPLWTVQPSLQAGVAVNADAPSILFTGVPADVAGAPWIRTPNASRTSTANPLVTFTINVEATVAVGVDIRVGRRPWVDSSWVDTGLQLVDLDGTTYRYFEVYEKAFSAGTVTLGPEADTAGLGAMYPVAVL
jgi:hypothetical protein